MVVYDRAHYVAKSGAVKIYMLLRAMSAHPIMGYNDYLNPKNGAMRGRYFLTILIVMTDKKMAKAPLTNQLTLFHNRTTAEIQ